MGEKFCTFELGSYPFYLIYTVGTSVGEIVEFLKQNDYKLGASEEEFILKRQLKNGWTLLLDSGALVLWLKQPPKTAYYTAALAHEAFHATSFLFTNVGVRYCEDSEEAWAYQIQFIVEKCYNSRVGFDKEEQK